MILLLRIFGQLSSSLLLFPQRFGQYVLRPSSVSSNFREGYRVRQTPEEGRRTYRPKRCGNNKYIYIYIYIYIYNIYIYIYIYMKAFLNRCVFLKPVETLAMFFSLKKCLDGNYALCYLLHDLFFRKNVALVK